MDYSEVLDAGFGSGDRLRRLQYLGGDYVWLGIITFPALALLDTTLPDATSACARCRNATARQSADLGSALSAR